MGNRNDKMIISSYARLTCLHFSHDYCAIFTLEYDQMYGIMEIVFRKKYYFSVLLI